MGLHDAVWITAARLRVVSMAVIEVKAILELFCGSGSSQHGTGDQKESLRPR